MAVLFPNHSRSHDTARCTVQFWGYDAVVEVLFRVTEEALVRMDAGATDSAGLLRAFDTHRDRIVQVAGRVYARRRQGSYDLVASDF
ncbi:MAG: DUF1488 domain-containing protein [Alphaproteobacteria bacterium]|nr:DUF1488 domain-containing protein [Alphaproteobacteria bacterium]